MGDMASSMEAIKPQIRTKAAVVETKAEAVTPVQPVKPAAPVKSEAKARPKGDGGKPAPKQKNDQRTTPGNGKVKSDHDRDGKIPVAAQAQQDAAVQALERRHQVRAPQMAQGVAKQPNFEKDRRSLRANDPKKHHVKVKPQHVVVETAPIELLDHESMNIIIKTSRGLEVVCIEHRRDRKGLFVHPPKKMDQKD